MKNLIFCCGHFEETYSIRRLYAKEDEQNIYFLNGVTCKPLVSKCKKKLADGQDMFRKMELFK